MLKKKLQESKGRQRQTSQEGIAIIQSRDDDSLYWSGGYWIIRSGLTFGYILKVESTVLVDRVDLGVSEKDEPAMTQLTEMWETHEDIFCGGECCHELNFGNIEVEKHSQHQSGYAKQALRCRRLEFRVEVQPGDLY